MRISAAQTNTYNESDIIAFKFDLAKRIRLLSDKESTQLKTCNIDEPIFREKTLVKRSRIIFEMETNRLSIGNALTNDTARHSDEEVR